MIRRSFLAALAGLVGGLFAARPTKAQPKSPEQFRRVFRHDGAAWKEIQWEEIRKGDKIVSLGIFDGTLEDISVYESASNYQPSFKGVHVGHSAELLPWTWGAKKDGTAP
jgi:hypothetical protein